MDRSYWSRLDVVQASRDFVCIRLATYEDAEEVEFLKKIFVGRSGDLENTVFVLLDSDGTTRLSKSGRSPDFAYWSANGFVKGLDEIAEKKASRKHRFSDTSLPLVNNVDLGLNIAACDHIQMVIVAGKNEEQIKSLSKKVLPLAWNDKIGGQFVFATAKSAKELRPLGVDKLEQGIYVVTPGEFGMSGKVVARFDESFDTKLTEQKLAEIAKQHVVNRDYREHINTGIQLGIEWKTQTPVTDKQSLQAKKRFRGK